MAKLTEEDDALLEALGVESEAKKGSSRTPREERVIAGFEEIQRFVEQHGRTPQHGEDRDIFERLYAVRLDRLRELDGCRTLLEPLDHQGLLAAESPAAAVKSADDLDDDELLAQLGVDVASPGDITELRHVRSTAEIRAAEEIADRERCEDFDRFEPLFELAERELKAGARQTRPFGKDASIDEGNLFILGGQLVYVAEVGETIKAPNGENDARLRVIYSNGTESNLLRRSLQRALYKDEAGRRVTDPNAGPLFSETWEDDDVESGTIYVLRSKSNHPFVSEHRELIHKIGVTGGKIETRIANAANDATYLLAEVEVVASYKLAGINRTKLENLFHRVFAPAQLDLTINDRFGHPVRPREWFLVPLHVIDEAVQRIRDGSITQVIYHPETASLIEG
ncbi:GIY-YIG nuclease family protein [Sinimarinibacterium flocculans]|uniref:T5orf172 domain-containing protein n=1 Tax=Sinimarinibacterium flocculans TaxID=985250 RepID=A0A318E6S2_9GAMM|nr:GIY-YIG nuclease family protein [Sinimarinibacterium flocculans]MEC9362934.1 GIY-YIG nuclease family protein [Pseudomonadota bacterium]PXV66038.1 T5orf172 domain-containing protein [Sinimarinibacterium flocculans]